MEVRFESGDWGENINQEKDGGTAKGAQDFLFLVVVVMSGGDGGTTSSQGLHTLAQGGLLPPRVTMDME